MRTMRVLNLNPKNYVVAAILLKDKRSCSVSLLQRLHVAMLVGNIHRYIPCLRRKPFLRIFTFYFLSLFINHSKRILNVVDSLECVTYHRDHRMCMRTHTTLAYLSLGNVQEASRSFFASAYHGSGPRLAKSESSG
jgi:hypothetical protein